LLFVQVVQAVLVLVGLELLQHTDWLGGPVPDLVAGLVLVTVLYLLFRLPFAAYQWAFQRPLSQSAPVRTVVFAARAAFGGA
jgi:glucose dehydrogenase